VSDTLAETDGDLSDSGTITFTDIDQTDNPTTAVSSTVITPANVTLSAGQSAAFASAFAIDSAGAWTFDLPAAASQFLPAGSSVSAAYTVTVDDHQGGTATQVVTITVTGTNDAPQITSAVVSDTLAETDGRSEEHTSEIQTLRHHVYRPTPAMRSTVITPANVTLSAGQSAAFASAFAIDRAWSLSFDLPAAPPRFPLFPYTTLFRSTVTVDDHQGGTATQVVTITVTGTNDAPQITSAVVSDTLAETDG